MLKLKKDGGRRFKCGHPWVFSNEIESGLKSYAAGEIVDLVDYKGLFLAKGYINPSSLITFRELSRDKNEKIDHGFFLKKIDSAKQYRERFLPADKSYRVVYGESDYLSGIIVDKYGDYLTVQVLTAGMERLTEEIISSLTEIFKPKGIVLRNDSRYREMEGLEVFKKVVFGKVEGPLMIEENGLKYEVDLLEGQKTGFFFDQRENRFKLREFVKGKSVLDCYCYSGGFSLNAAYSGAKKVLGVDSSVFAVDTAKKNSTINGFTNVDFEKADAEEKLKAFAKEGIKFDVVILDPPSLVKNRKSFFGAKRLYTEINSMAMTVLNKEGILVTCSCSQLMPEAEFVEMIADASIRSDRKVKMIHRGNQAVDHPVLSTVPETAYLKCLFLEVS